MAWRLIGGLFVTAVVTSAARAQTPFQLSTTASSDVVTAELGGTPTVDIIRLRATGPGTPLRFGNIVQGSETVQLDSRVLAQGQDYALDAAAGVIYLRCAQRDGQTLTVCYRYKAGPAPVASSLTSGINGFKYSLVPGGLNLLMGLGLTDRTADGTVLSGNVFGWDNTLKFGQSGSLGGLYVYGQRTKNDVQSGLQMDSSAKPGDALAGDGASQLILQHLGTKVLGGTLSADYQDVSQNFANFSAVSGSGYDAATLARLQSEKGLTRFGFGLKDMKFGSLGVSNSYRTISDSAGSLEWRSYGLHQGGLSLDYSSQKVDKGFTRFKDIAEANRDQLMREAGMGRSNIAGQFAQKAGSISFKTYSIEDSGSSKQIQHSEYGLDTSKIKFNLGSQEVDRGFNRIDSLMDTEKASFGREIGLKRQWMSLQAGFTKGALPISYASMSLQSGDGRFTSQDVAVRAKSWSLQQVTRTSNAKFVNIGSLSDAEQDASIRAIGNMYGPGVQTRPEDRGAFTLGSGISRVFTSFGAQPYKDWDVQFNQLALKGQTDGGKVDTIAMKNSKMAINYRHQDLGRQFSEQSRLMGFEQQKLGTIAGLDRTDFGFNMNLGRGRNLVVSKLTASTLEGGANRTSLGYTDKKIDVQVNAREVDTGFASVNNLVDTEKDLLASLRGYAEKDARVKWQILPNLKIDAYLSDMNSAATDTNGKVQNVVLDWAPDKKSQLNYTRTEQKTQDPLNVLFAHAVERISFSRDLGKYGRVSLLDEHQTYEGTQSGGAADSRRQSLTFDTKFDKLTSLHSEQTRTNFDNGDKENVSSNTVSREIAKNAGISVTEMAIDRNGNDRDEKKRNYGFWFDLGNGLRVSYGYARQLAGTTAGTLSSTFTVGQNGQGLNADQMNAIQQAHAGGLMFGGGYGVNQWDADGRTQAFSNFAVATAKPMRIGFVSDVSLKFGMDTASDYSNWLRENRTATLAGRIGSNQFGYDYVSQMHQTGVRGIDRVYRLQSDASDKRWLKASIFYKVRTLPWDEEVMIRDFNITARPAKNLELTNQLQTNPEVARGDVFMGSMPQAARSNKWKLDWTKSDNLTIGGSWQELLNEDSKAKSTTGGVNLKLFAKSGSPLSVFYGVEEMGGNVAHTLTQRYSFQFDQRPGKNQMLSVFAGNISYDYNVVNATARNNWTLRLNYQLKF